MNYFQFITASDIEKLVTDRSGEIKIGQKINIGFAGSKYVVLGIPESIGVKGNLGIAGTESLWFNFLSYFLNIQSTEKLNGSEISILGHFDFKGLLEGQHLPAKNYRDAVEIIDEEVSYLISEIVNKGKIPIVIGGGHNNCFPIIAGVNKGLQNAHKLSTKGINVINLDAHSDYRSREGRHSGNGFRYAMEAGILKKYAIVGLHENYNAQALIDEMSQKASIMFSFWEDIFLREVQSYSQAVQQAISFTQGNYTGIELDLDSIEKVLASAYTPSGISATNARQYLYQTGKMSQVAYLHICEGAVFLENGQEDFATGKLVSYLVSDFVKANVTF